VSVRLSCNRLLAVSPPAENFGGFGPRPARHRVCLQRQDELHDAVRLDVSLQLTAGYLNESSEIT